MNIYMGKILKGQQVILSLEGIQHLLDDVKDSEDLPNEEKQKFKALKCERDDSHSHHGLGTFDAFRVHI